MKRRQKFRRGISMIAGGFGPRRGGTGAGVRVVGRAGLAKVGAATKPALLKPLAPGTCAARESRDDAAAGMGGAPPPSSRLGVRPGKVVAAAGRRGSS